MTNSNLYKYRYDNVVGRNTRILQLKSLLDDSEYSAARESTLTAFYTPKVVIDAMYQAISQMGFTEKTAKNKA